MNRSILEENEKLKNEVSYLKSELAFKDEILKVSLPKLGEFRQANNNLVKDLDYLKTQKSEIEQKIKLYHDLPVNNDFDRGFSKALDLVQNLISQAD